MISQSNNNIETSSNIHSFKDFVFIFVRTFVRTFLRSFVYLIFLFVFYRSFSIDELRFSFYRALKAFITTTNALILLKVSDQKIDSSKFVLRTKYYSIDFEIVFVKNLISSSSCSYYVLSLVSVFYLFWQLILSLFLCKLRRNSNTSNNALIRSFLLTSTYKSFLNSSKNIILIRLIIRLMNNRCLTLRKKNRKNSRRISCSYILREAWLFIITCENNLFL